MSLLLLLLSCARKPLDTGAPSAFECVCPGEDDTDGWFDPCATSCASTDPECDDCDCDGLPASEDCDDHDDSVYPGQPDTMCDCRDDVDCDGLTNEDQQPEELCDGIDNNCDNVIDENLWETVSDCWFDLDADGWGGVFGDTVTCEPEEVICAPQGGDCDDHDDAIHPAAAEAPNGRDDDCDGDIDEP